MNSYYNFCNICYEHNPSLTRFVFLFEQIYMKMTIPFEESSYKFSTRKVFSMFCHFCIEKGMVLVFIEGM